MRSGRAPASASVLAKAAGLGLVAKIGVTTTAAAAGVIGAGAAGVLPGDADRVVRDAIEVVTPVEFTDSGDLDDGPGRGRPGEGEPAPTTDSGDVDDGPGRGRPGRGEPEPTADPADPVSSGVPSVPGEHGDRVSPDATGESDGEPGVDGPAVAEQAPGAEHRPAEPPGASGGTPPSTVPPAAGGRDDAADGTAQARPRAGADTPPSTNP